MLNNSAHLPGSILTTVAIENELIELSEMNAPPPSPASTTITVPTSPQPMIDRNEVIEVHVESIQSAPPTSLPQVLPSLHELAYTLGVSIDPQMFARWFSAQGYAAAVTIIEQKSPLLLNMWGYFGIVNTIANLTRELNATSSVELATALTKWKLDPDNEELKKQVTLCIQTALCAAFQTGILFFLSSKAFCQIILPKLDSDPVHQAFVSAYPLYNIFNVPAVNMMFVINWIALGTENEQDQIASLLGFISNGLVFPLSSKLLLHMGCGPIATITGANITQITAFLSLMFGHWYRQRYFEPTLKHPELVLNSLLSYRFLHLDVWQKSWLVMSAGVQRLSVLLAQSIPNLIIPVLLRGTSELPIFLAALPYQVALTTTLSYFEQILSMKVRTAHESFNANSELQAASLRRHILIGGAVILPLPLICIVFGVSSTAAAVLSESMTPSLSSKMTQYLPIVAFTAVPTTIVSLVRSAPLALRALHLDYEKLNSLSTYSSTILGILGTLAGIMIYYQTEDVMGLCLCTLISSCINMCIQAELMRRCESRVRYSFFAENSPRQNTPEPSSTFQPQRQGL